MVDPLNTFDWFCGLVVLGKQTKEMDSGKELSIISQAFWLHFKVT